MKNKSLFVSRLVTMFIVVGIVGIGIEFILDNLGMHKSLSSINSLIGVICGGIAGYKLNDLLREFKK